MSGKIKEEDVEYLNDLIQYILEGNSVYIIDQKGNNNCAAVMLFNDSKMEIQYITPGFEFDSIRSFMFHNYIISINSLKEYVFKSKEDYEKSISICSFLENSESKYLNDSTTNDKLKSKEIKEENIKFNLKESYWLINYKDHKIVPVLFVNHVNDCYILKI
jgi:hypothetical protein